LELREKERRRRRSLSESSYGVERRRMRHEFGGERKHSCLPQRQPTPIKIPKFKRENDPNI